jgi:hypothetical protein
MVRPPKSKYGQPMAMRDHAARAERLGPRWLCWAFLIALFAVADLGGGPRVVLQPQVEYAEPAADADRAIAIDARIAASVSVHRNDPAGLTLVSAAILSDPDRPEAPVRDAAEAFWPATPGTRQSAQWRPYDATGPPAPGFTHHA